MKKFLVTILGVMIMLTATANAKSIRTPTGNMPRVQWAVVESTEGTMAQMIEIGARVLAPTTANETGTYALYGVIEKNNPNLMRLLEIYESDEAYRIHSTSPAFQQYRAERTDSCRLETSARQRNCSCAKKSRCRNDCSN